MRVRILSDLHREFGHVELPDIPADLVILAGDIDRGTRGVAWAKQRFPDTPVLYVCGNHEFYGERIGRLQENLREATAGSNVRLLDNEVADIGGWSFFGATLWTDFNLLGDPQSAMFAAASKTTGMNDYRKIRRLDTGRLMPKHTALLHAESRLALTRFLDGTDRSRSVVITHHAPTFRSIPAQKRNAIASAAYASNLDELIMEHGPAVWIHGHIHSPRDFIVGRTQILNNAQGYPDETTRTYFRTDLVIEL